MPIYEYYCPDNHTIYQFYAKTLAQGQQVPRCPDNPKFTLKKIVSAFAITGTAEEKPAAPAGPDAADDPRMDAAMESLEQEFSTVDENDPRAMGRMMRRMAELSGEKVDGTLEEVVRKLEEGTDPDALEDKLGLEPEGPEDTGDPLSGGIGREPGAPGDKADPKEPRHRFRVKRALPRRDPKLYDFD